VFSVDSPCLVGRGTYYAAAGAPKTLWEVPGSGHVGGIDAQPKQYERHVVGFFDRSLLGER
jgi:fermentation-respiration switch protein FrsA (DUF1100 family)